MPETVHTSSQELTARQIQRLVENGARVSIEVDALGSSLSVSVRECDGIYYCDTQMKLLTHETAAEFRAFLCDQQLATRPAGGAVSTSQTPG